MLANRPITTSYDDTDAVKPTGFHETGRRLHSGSHPALPVRRGVAACLLWLQRDKEWGLIDIESSEGYRQACWLLRDTQVGPPLRQCNTVDKAVIPAGIAGIQNTGR